eukprot:403341768
MEVLVQKKKILGKISYDILNTQQALIDIELHLSKQDFDDMLKERQQESYLVIIIDKSGSMIGGPIRCVREQCRLFAEKYFNTRKSIHPPTIIFFNDAINVIKENTLKGCLDQIDLHCVASGGTRFPEPMKHLLQLVQETNVKELFVLFMTDGLDNVPHETRPISLALKKELLKKEVYSKFNVIGIGMEHQSDQLGMMLDIGTQRGVYQYMQNPQDEQVMTQFFKEGFREQNVEPGIIVSLPNDRQVYCSLKENENDQLILEKKGIVVMSQNVEQLLVQFNQDNQTKYSNVQMQDKTGQLRQDGWLLQLLYAQIREINFDSTNEEIIQTLTNLKTLIQNEYRPLSVFANDDFLTHEYDHITRDCDQLLTSLQGAKSCHFRTKLEQVRNEIVKRQEMGECEMRIGKGSDVRKSVGYLFFVLKKLKRPLIQIKAIGAATQIQDKIINELKRDIKGYKIEVEYEKSKMFGNLDFVNAIVRSEEIVSDRSSGKKLYGDEPHNEDEYQKKKGERRDRDQKNDRRGKKDRNDEEEKSQQPDNHRKERKQNRSREKNDRRNRKRDGNQSNDVEMTDESVQNTYPSNQFNTELGASGFGQINQPQVHTQKEIQALQQQYQNIIQSQNQQSQPNSSFQAQAPLGAPVLPQRPLDEVQQQQAKQMQQIQAQIEMLQKQYQQIQGQNQQTQPQLQQQQQLPNNTFFGQPQQNYNFQGQNQQNQGRNLFEVNEQLPYQQQQLFYAPIQQQVQVIQQQQILAPNFNQQLQTYEKLKSDKILNHKFGAEKLYKKLFKMTKGRKLKINRFLSQNDGDLNVCNQTWEKFNQENAGHKLTFRIEEFNEQDRGGNFVGVLKAFIVSNNGQQ